MHHPSATSNRIPILEKLKQILSGERVQRALEVSSGTGAHIEVFAPEFKDVVWQPTEYVPSVQATSEEDAFDKYGKIGMQDHPLETLNRNLASLPNVSKAMPLDLTDAQSIKAFPESSFGLVHAGNVLHICPATGIDGFFRLSSRVLRPNGIVTLYGPFKRHGEFTTESNAQFDDTLRKKNPDFGLRDVESQIVPAAQRYGFGLVSIFDMPKNNFLMVFKRTSPKL